MPKSQFYDPEKVCVRGKLSFQDIPLLQYDKTMAQELEAGNYQKEDLIRIYAHMVAIREFETMLESIRVKKEYHGVRHGYNGPAHLYIGEEAAAVGQAYLLDENDYIFGNHRSHGEVIAKGLNCIHKMEDEALLKIMEETHEGRQLSVIRCHYPGGSIKEDAKRFFFYGLICELFGRENGFCKSLGNSMHLFFAPFGIYPNNAIVGGGVGIATGGALYKKVNKKKGICISNAGDGSLGCGPVWEAFQFASMDQYHTLWEGDRKGGLPILYQFIDNGYGMGGQTKGETMGFGTLARAGAGINPQQMHAERVDGFNPLAVIDAYRRKLPLLHKGEGPVLLDVMAYRLCGHSVSDHGSYRTQEEVETWRAYDPITLFRQELLNNNIADEKQLDDIWEGLRQDMIHLLTLAVDDEISPIFDLTKDPEAISRYIFSNQKIEKMEDRPCEWNIPYEENERRKKLAAMDRTKVTYCDSLFEAILHKFNTDPTLITYGEEIRDWGGAFGVFEGMSKELPHYRLFNSSISEAAIVATGVGYAMCGGRSLIELMYCDFMGRAGDEIFNQLAKWQAMSAGALKLPVVLRVAVGAKYGAQHSQDWTSLPAHIPGLKVVFPATPYDAKGLLNSALNGTDPVIFFESQRLYEMEEKFHEGGVPEEYYEIPLGQPDIKRQGKDITILTIGATLYQAIEAAKELEEKWGIQAEVIDARSLVPFDYTLLLQSVEKTGRLLLVSDAGERGSFLNDIARNVTEQCFGKLKAAPYVMGTRNWITPSFELEKDFFPQPQWILDAIHQRFIPLEGHVCHYDFSNGYRLQEAKKGL